MHSGTLILRIDSQLDHVFLVGLAVRGICAATPLDNDQVNAVELSAVEAVNNVIEHGYGEQPGHAVEVEVSIASGVLRIEVRATAAPAWTGPPPAPSLMGTPPITWPRTTIFSFLGLGLQPIPTVGDQARAPRSPQPS